MRIVLIIFFYLICLKPVLAQTEDYSIFLNALEISENISIDSSVIEHNTFWKKFINVNRDTVIFSNKKSGMFESIFKNYKRPDTRPYFERKLMIGNKLVEERRTRDANNIIGFAQCVNGTPFIFFAFKENPSISSEAIVFFREHEFAHFKLGHSGCGVDSSFKDSHSQELEADLEAAITILNFPEGTRIIDFVIATFYTLNEKQSRSHPSSYARAASLLRNLNTNKLKYK
ncbi:hypothetical protein ACFPIK_01575 [Algoriphagus aquatilis]|uniref:Uncharacterized protein n=1 Tax=Algoriphagus aquatilis TaxID=490186 RepID=A0ABW0BS41_9BACT